MTGETKELREDHPSGWLYLVKHDEIPVLVDSLLDFPPDREFDEDGLAEHAGVTPKSVGNHIDLLVEVELIEEVAGTSPPRYRIKDSDVVRALHEFNSALNNTGSE